MESLGTRTLDEASTPASADGTTPASFSIYFTHKHETPAGMAPGFVTLGLRPEKARVVPQAEHAGGLPFTLDAVEELGASRLLHGRAAGADVVAAADAALPIPQGPLALHADPADLHFFDAVTGTRL